MSDEDELVAVTKPKVGHIVVVLDRSSKRKFCGEVVSAKSSSMSLECVTDIGDIEEIDLPYSTAHVLADLGEIPLVGSVYGATVRKLYSTTTHSFWGRIAIMRNMPEDERDALKSALKKSQATIKSIGLDKAINLDYFIVGEAKGKYAGRYQHDKKGTRILLNPKELNSESSKYIVDHELAHAIWHQTLSDEKRAKWVHLFTQFTERVSAPEDTLQEVIDLVASSSNFLSGYKELIGSSDIEYGLEWFQDLCQALCAIHLFDLKDLDLYLWSISAKKRKAELTRASQNLTYLYGERTDHPVSEYGSTNVGEMFSEAYAFYVNRISMHPEVTNLLLETLPNLKNI